MQAHIVNPGFQRVPLALESEFDFPHMTLVKLESGEAERLHNETIWKSSVTQSRLNVSQMLTQINHDVKCAGLPFRLIPVHVEQCNCANRYNLWRRRPRCLPSAAGLHQPPTSISANLLHLGLRSKLKLTRASRATVLAMPLDNQGSRCTELGAGCVQQWSQEPAHPHITYEYPSFKDDLGNWCWDDTASSVRSGSDSRASSLESGPRS